MPTLKTHLLLICIAIAAMLAGCASTPGTFANRLTCSVARDKAYMASLYGPVGVTAEIDAADAAVVCAPAKAAPQP